MGEDTAELVRYVFENTPNASGASMQKCVVNFAASTIVFLVEVPGFERLVQEGGPLCCCWFRRWR